MNLSDVGPVVLVGAGKMGLALARGWLAAGLLPAHLVLVEPTPVEATTAFARENGVRLLPAASGVLTQVLVLAVKPQIIADVMREVRPTIGAHTLVVSIAAGIPIRTIAAGLDTERIIRTMPNTPSQIGKGITGLVAGPRAGAADREIATLLMRAAGEVVWLEAEPQLDAVTAVSGSGPAYVFYLVEAMAEAGAKLGLTPEQAMQLARQTIIGAAALMEADLSPVAVLRQNVTSPQGTTAAALDVLMAPDGMRMLMQRAVNAARLRSEQLGRSA